MHIGSFSPRSTIDFILDPRGGPHAGPSTPFARTIFYGSCMHTCMAAYCHVLSTFRFALCIYTFFICTGVGIFIPKLIYFDSSIKTTDQPPDPVSHFLSRSSVFSQIHRYALRFCYTVPRVHDTLCLSSVSFFPGGFEPVTAAFAFLHHITLGFGLV